MSQTDQRAAARRAHRPSRRSALKRGLGAAAVAGAPALLVRRAHGAGPSDPGGGRTVTVGFNVARSGPYAEEGADELRAGKLAVGHLNGEGDGGMMNTLTPSALTGEGILGRKVGYVTGDTRARADAARASARRMIEDGALMIAGGASPGAAVAVQALCQDAGILFMAGPVHSNELTGEARRAHGFRHFLNAYMSGAGLGPVLASAHGTERRAYHLSADHAWGRAQEASLQAATEALGWRTVRKVATAPGAADFDRYLAPVLDSGADTLVLNHFGVDAIEALSRAARSGLRERQVDGKDFAIVVPLHTRLTVRGAGDAVEGVHGSVNWHHSLGDPGSRAFVESFEREYGFPPSQAAHTCYVQTLLWADACERAGTFAPCEVIAALEGFAFDGLGNGPTEYRAGDHQCLKDVLVVRGRANPDSPFDRLEVVGITPRAQVEYPVDHPMFAGGELGGCGAA